ncbi:MAG: aminotransferase class I/II-fold pyridoxal phosphate-dependent enzyme [Pseudomonadota bacterium]
MTEVYPSARSVVEPFHAMDILASATKLAAQGTDIISLAVGQPSSKPPQIVREAAAAAAMNITTGYTNALGRDELRRAISTHYTDAYGLSISPERVAVTTGSSAAFSLAFLAAAEPGDRVAITAPGYPAYRNIVKALSLECVELQAPDGGFDLDALAAEHAQRPIKILLLASPANPTGSVLSEGSLGRIVSFCQTHGIVFFSDEIYHRLNHVGDDVCALRFSDDVIIINSFSKFYNMTGWRIGWMVLPENLVRTVERLAQSIYICPPDISQIAATKAFDAPAELRAAREVYRTNRQMLLKRLPAMGLDFAAPPDGAFYAWLDASRFTNDTMSFAHRMLNEIGVATAPGIDFDPFNGGARLRLSYCGSTQEVTEALDRIEAWLPG